MKTPEQIMHSFRLHTLHNRSGCIGCAYRDPNKISFKCQDELFKDVREYIKQLQEAVEQWELVASSPGTVEDIARENTMLTKYARQREKQVTELSAANVKLQKEISQLKAERDAVIRDLQECAQCGHCKHQEKNLVKCNEYDFYCVKCDCVGCACLTCDEIEHQNWEWRGIQREDGNGLRSTD